MFEALTAGSVKISNCLSAVDTTRLLLSVLSAMAVMSCPFLSINFWITCTASKKCTFTGAQLLHLQQLSQLGTTNMHVPFHSKLELLEPNNW